MPRPKPWLHCKMRVGALLLLLALGGTNANCSGYSDDSITGLVVDGKLRCPGTYRTFRLQRATAAAL